MNREDIIRMFEKANGWSVKDFENTIDDLERFAHLVAAAEREACAQIAFNAKTYLEAAHEIRERGAP